VFRIGGEEFLCVLPDCSAPEALAAAERLRTGFQEAALMVNGQLIEATLSAGIAVGVAGQTDFDELILEADRRLYMAKQQGRNRVVAQNLGGGSHRCYSS
jgi:diguanylate cyclase (GGDEF)-like protein